MKEKRKIMVLLAIGVFCGLILWPTSAQATLITIQIEAAVDSVRDEGNYLEGKIKPGDIILGFYVYESTTPDSSPLDPVQGNYWNYAPPAGIALTVGGFNFMTDPFNIAFRVAIRNNAPGDVYSIGSSDNLPLSNGVPVNEILWSLKDPSGTALSSDALPPTAPVLDQWGETLLRMDSDRMWGIDAEVTSAEIIPEPSIILFLGLGSVFLRKRQ
jgi:hypothetical protein